MIRLTLRSLLVSVVALSGCVAFPELPDGKSVSLIEVIDNVECDIKNALLNDLAGHYWLLGWAATINLNIETYNSSAGSGEAIISVPLSANTLGLTLSTGPTKEYNSVGTLGYSTYLTDIAARQCGNKPTKTKSVLTGRTGAGDWLVRVAKDAAQANICPDKIDFGLEFIISIDGEGNPTISGIVIGSGTLETDLDLVGASTKDHEVTLSAVPVGRVVTDKSEKQINRVLARASDIVHQETGVRMSKHDFLHCVPVGGGVFAGQRELVDNETIGALDKAVAGALVRSLGSDPIP